MSNNTRLAELMNYITIDTTSGTQLQVSGSVKQSSVTSAILKTDSTGVLVAATEGTDFLTSVGISDLTATGTPSSTSYLRGDNTWATLTIGGTLPEGGTAGQLLAKIDATNYNTTWIDNFATQLKHEVKLGGSIAKGKAVYVSSADGTNMIVSAASNASEATSSKTLGLVETGGVLNDIVKVVTEGLLAGLNTSTAVVGDPVWLGTNGDLLYGLANKPYAPAHLVSIGIVTRVQTNNGEIFVKPQNGFEMYELHNVSALSPANNAILAYNTTTSLWEKNTIVGTLGYTPYNATNPSSFIALTALSSTATGLTYTDTTGVFSLTAGYVIPTTSSATNWDTSYTNRITSLTTTGSSGAATLTTNTLNIPTYTLAGLGGQPQLNGTGFVKVTGTTISYDNSTYYLASNPSGYTTNTGTVTSVGGTGTVSGLTLTGTVTTTGNLTLGGTLSLTSGNVTTALGFTPYNATNPSSYVALGSAITGYTVGANTALAATDTILGAFNKIQGQLNGKQASGSYLTSYSETSTLANVTARGATTNAAITVNGDLTVGSGGASSIFMNDSDEGQRMVHCNSNRIGFLTQAQGWGSYCNDDGSWVSVGDITAFSDARIKENIETVDNALDKTLRLRGVYYNRTDTADKSKKLGVIAQEMQEVVPEVVHEEADGLLGVSYGNLSGLFIEAFKELNAKVVSQDAQITELMEIIKTLKGL